MKKSLFFALLLIGYTSFTKTDEKKPTPILKFQKNMNQFLQSIADNPELLTLYPSLLLSLADKTEHSEILQEFQDPDSSSSQLLSFLEVLPHSFVEGLLDAYNRSTEDTESASVSLFFPGVIKVTIDGKDVEVINGFPIEIDLTKTLAETKKFKEQ